jgi:hypothetical protein
VGCERADAEYIPITPDPAQLVEPIEAHEVRRTDDAVADHQEQRGAASQQARLVPVALGEIHRLHHAACLVVLESPQTHQGNSSSRALIAAPPSPAAAPR